MLGALETALPSRTRAEIRAAIREGGDSVRRLLLEFRHAKVSRTYANEDAGLLAVLEGVKRASRDWAANNRDAASLTHATDRLAAAERLTARPDLPANLEPTDREYLAACRKVESAARGRRRRMQASIYILLVGVIAGLVGWINQSYIAEQWRWRWTDRPFVAANIWPYVLTAADEQALKPKDTFGECSPEQGKDFCPQMVVLPAGSFIMGSPATEQGHQPSEGPQHQVTIAKPFAVSKSELTFDEWDTCVNYDGCPQGVTDSGWGHGQQPVINVTWGDAQHYVAWLSKMTGKPYRLLTEAEYEFATRARAITAYSWGYDIGTDNANCKGCGSQWDNTQTAPVGSFAANAFGLFDMAGNVWEWVEDCVNNNYDDAPTDGSAWIEGGGCKNRIVRGGSWNNTPVNLRSANRVGTSAGFRDNLLGFRVARTLIVP
jgi:formylglycine-generating enzyme required for sulfatase activity